MIQLAQEIIAGKRITRKDDLSPDKRSNFRRFLTVDLKELCQGADMIREQFVGEGVDLCWIIIGRWGKFAVDCYYCGLC